MPQGKKRFGSSSGSRSAVSANAPCLSSRRTQSSSKATWSSMPTATGVGASGDFAPAAVRTALKKEDTGIISGRRQGFARDVCSRKSSSMYRAGRA